MIKEKKGILKKTIIFLILILGIFYSYIRFVEPKLIIVKEIAITDEMIPESFNGFKIVEFSDIHYGTSINDTNIKNVIDKINGLKADVVIFNGDLFNEYLNYNEENFNIIKENFSNIKVSLKKIAIIGDQDYPNKEKYLEIMEDSGFTVLDNSHIFLYYKENIPLMFIGTSSYLHNELDLDKAFYDDIITDEYYKILISHEPIIFDYINDNTYKPNIIMASHTLNGLVNIPFKGYLLNQDGINNYMGNFYEKNNIKMYVSNGLGTYKYNVRFLNAPSINLYRIYNN